MMFKIKSTEEYKQVEKEYGEIYKGDTERLKREAVGKLIAKEILNIYKEGSITESQETKSFIKVK